MIVHHLSHSHGYAPSIHVLLVAIAVGIGRGTEAIGVALPPARANQGGYYLPVLGRIGKGACFALALCGGLRLVKRREKRSELLGHALQVKAPAVAVADDSSSCIVLGDECKAPASPYIIYIVGRTLGELKVLEATCRGLADAEDLACQLRGCRLVDGLSKGALGESREGKE